MVARLQRWLVVSLLAATTAWLVYFWHSAPLLALAGLAMPGLAYGGALALELVALRRVNRINRVPVASWRELARAWLGEMLAGPSLFCWRQPFRSRLVSDQMADGSIVRGRRGLVFIHGFLCNRGFWTPWLQQLEGTGHAFVALNLEPVFGSIDDYIPQIEEAVQRVTSATGLPPLLVCHSMGGLAARAWLTAMQAQARIFHVVTLGTPHHGTWLARFSHVANGRQMRQDGPWLRDLNRHAHSHSLFTCWYANSDNIVLPSDSATLPGADNRLLRGVAHVQLAFLPEVMKASLAMLEENALPNLPKV